MATCTWSGATSNLWNVAGNWDTLPSAGDDLVFPLTPTGNKSNSNNFAADTSFNSITIQGTGYTLAGNRITLGAGGITQTTGTNTISLAIVLGANVTVSVEGTTLTLSGIISDGAGSAVAKTGTAWLILSGANSFTGGLWIKAGTVYGPTNINAFGANANVISIGDSSGSADATLYGTGLLTYPQSIVTVAGTSGLLKILAHESSCFWSGTLTLNNDLTLQQGGLAWSYFYNDISGAGNLTIDHVGTGTIELRGGTSFTGNLSVLSASSGQVKLVTTPLNHTGTITNSGTGTGTTTISAVIGTNVTGVIQNSATSQLTLSGANTFTSGLTIKAGTVSGTTSANAFGANTNVITLGDSSGSADATLSGGFSGTFLQSITVAAGSSGTKKLTISSVNGVFFGGAISLADNLVIGTSVVYNINISGGISGTGNVTLSTTNASSITYASDGAWNFAGTLTHSGNNLISFWTAAIGSNVTGVVLAGTGAQTVTLAGGVNCTGQIVNQGTTTGTTTISSVVGTNVTGVIQNSATSKLILSGAGTIANCSDKFQVTSGQLQLSTANTVTNLFVDATACTNKTAQLILAANQTVTGELKLRGSVANRLLCTSDTLGTARTLTVTGATISNNQTVDFRDLTFANGGSNVNLSAITGGSGDCGGNTISGGGTLSFTTADDWYWYSASGGTYNLSDRTYWFTATNGGGTQMAADRGPLPQDMLYVDSSSINGTTTIDQDMPRMPGIDFTGCDAVGFHTDNLEQRVYGSFTAVANVTRTTGVNFNMIFESRSAVVFAPGNVTNPVRVAAIGRSVTLSANFPGESTSLALDNGLLDADAYNVSCRIFAGDGSLSRTLLMGTGTWTATQQFRMSTTNLTSTSVGETSTIVFGSATDSTARTFAGGGLTYNNLSIVANTTGTQQITISGNNTFTGTLTINGPKTVNFTAGSVQTVASFVTTGTGITLKSTSAGSPWYLVDSSGTNQVSNATISDSYPRGSDAGGGALWDADIDRKNVDGGGNERHNFATNRGWRFTDRTKMSAMIGCCF